MKERLCEGIIPFVHRLTSFFLLLNPSVMAEVCPICLTVLQDNETVVTTPCRHQMHKQCFDQYVQQQSREAGEAVFVDSQYRNVTCPICRGDLSSMLSEYCSREEEETKRAFRELERIKRRMEREIRHQRRRAERAENEQRMREREERMEKPKEVKAIAVRKRKEGEGER
jgi:hypothetical protein